MIDASESRNRNRRQNGQHGHHDHKFNQGEALLARLAIEHALGAGLRQVGLKEAHGGDLAQ